MSAIYPVDFSEEDRNLAQYAVLALSRRDHDWVQPVIGTPGFGELVSALKGGDAVDPSELLTALGAVHGLQAAGDLVLRSGDRGERMFAWVLDMARRLGDMDDAALRAWSREWQVRGGVRTGVSA